MGRIDLILLHAPSRYDFREQRSLLGPVSDMVPSTQVFEMYPFGFMTMLDHLERHGFSVRIINMALRMLRSRRFDPERLLRSLRPRAFGIDLHWLVHAHGALELAAVAKRLHPDIPVIVGGMSASCFHEELIRYPQIDYVLRGDSVEEPLRLLMAAIRGSGVPTDVPNLTWKQGDGAEVNDLTHVPPDLDGVAYDYRTIMRSSLRHLDIVGYLPFKRWLRHPIVATPVCRGCKHNCVICGGSFSAFQSLCGRTGPAMRSPSLVARDIARIGRTIRTPLMLSGDVQQGGHDYCCDLLRAIGRERVRDHIAFEFFVPPEPDFLAAIAAAVPRFSLQISPESHDESVRRAFGRPYGNAKLEQAVQTALRVGCTRVDLFFMVGLPQQTPASVGATVDYCRELIAKSEQWGFHGRVHPYTSPLAPFLDPGSRAFAAPEKHGYRLFRRTLEEHRLALAAPTWMHTLNYETDWMTREGIAHATYDSARGLNALKRDARLIDERSAARQAARIDGEQALLTEIAGRMDESGTEQNPVAAVTKALGAVGGSTLCGENEMDWPAALFRFNPWGVLCGALGVGSGRGPCPNPDARDRHSGCSPAQTAATDAHP